MNPPMCRNGKVHRRLARPIVAEIGQNTAENFFRFFHLSAGP